MDKKHKSALVTRLDGIHRLARNLENELFLARAECSGFCERTENMLNEAYIVAINLARSIDEASAWEESKESKEHNLLTELRAMAERYTAHKGAYGGTGIGAELNDLFERWL
jgi:hypothetical protein